MRSRKRARSSAPSKPPDPDVKQSPDRAAVVVGMVGAVKYSDGKVDVVELGDVSGHDVAAKLICALNAML